MKLKDIVANSTLENVKAGTRAVKTVKFRLASVAPQPVDADPDAPDQALASVGLRMMTGGEIANAYHKAQQFSTSRGVKEWDDAHPLCMLGLMINTLAVTCLDLDSSPGTQELFFESAEEVLASNLIGPDNIAYLYDVQRDWQESCGIQKREMSMAEVLEVVHQMASEEAQDPLALLRPGTRVNFLRTLAALVVTLLPGKLDSGTILGSSMRTTPNDSEMSSEQKEKVSPDDDTEETN